MFRVSSLVLILLMGADSISAQKFKPHIENVRTDLIDNCLVVTYDIVGSSPGQSHKIDLVVIDNMGNVILPDSVSGDVGPEVQVGMNKVITWDIHKEYDIVHGNFQAQIVLDGSKKYGVNGGPGNLFLSMLVPGLGDYFVADHKNMKIKPYYKTAFTAGVLGLSLMTFRNRAEIPPVMAPPGYYISADAPPGEKFLYIDHYWEKEPASTDYWLFPADGEIILGIGIASWLFDVIWVARKGVQNNRIRSQFIDHISLVPADQGAVLRFTYNF